MRLAADRRSRTAPAPLRDDHVNSFFHPQAPRHMNNPHTHLAFHFHGVTVGASQRLRLIETPIHVSWLQFKRKKKESSAAFARTERGSGSCVSAGKPPLLRPRFR